jgi:hypothetical protein
VALPLIKLGLAAAAGYFFYNQYRRGAFRRHTLSTTNASDAVDDIHVRPDATLDEKLDESVKETFPASDPVSMAQPSETAYEREQRLKRKKSF